MQQVGKDRAWHSMKYAQNTFTNYYRSKR